MHTLMEHDLIDEYHFMIQLPGAESIRCIVVGRCYCFLFDRQWVVIHFLISGEWESLRAMAVGGLFIPTLAVALGIWSGNGKLFQFIFMLIWYRGPLEKLNVMDFIGTSQQSLDRGIYRYYLLAIVILLLLAVIGRLRQVRAYR